MRGTRETLRRRLTVALTLTLSIGAAAQDDALDCLMPRPRLIAPAAGVRFEPAERPLGDAGYYRLSIAGGKVVERRGDAEALRYADATLGQLRLLARGGALPDCTIEDWPEFRYRGLLLDCGRNYQSVESILDIIDHLSRYKYNLFHWHLTDNYGWRLESQRYPQLQSAAAFTRHPGKYYTMREFRQVLDHAKMRGVTVLPELDMPGHTLAFRRAFGIESLATEDAKRILGELIDELCSLATAEEMPFVHLGTDEARERGEKVPASHLEHWLGRVRANGRTPVAWAPGLVRRDAVLQLWTGAKDPRRSDLPYLDSQNSYYINHVDPEELLAVAAFQQPCRWGRREERLGAVIGVWHDDAIAATEDVARMNAVYPAVTLLSDSFWRGRDRDEPAFYARLPRPDDPRFALAADLERRTVAQRDRVLHALRHPFPYVAQTMMRWRLSDGEGRKIAADIPQATVYPRHFWFAESSYVPENRGTVTLETWIVSREAVECGAWIGMNGVSRSDGRSRDQPTPKLGEWNRHGATVELNGERLPPPHWRHPCQTGNPKEIPLVDEDYWYREPARIRLKQGVNHVRMTLPKRGGWKWIGTFVPVLGTSDHPREVPGLEYFSAPPHEVEHGGAQK